MKHLIIISKRIIKLIKNNNNNEANHDNNNDNIVIMKKVIKTNDVKRFVSKIIKIILSIMNKTNKNTGINNKNRVNKASICVYSQCVYLIRIHNLIMFSLYLGIQKLSNISE